MSRKSGEKKDPWLLIKSKDEYARKAGEPEIVDEEMTSYLTGRSNDELAAEGDIRADHASRARVVKTALPNPSRLKGAKKAGLKVFGGVNAPYIWVRTPKGITSWQAFDRILGEANVVITPGSGFGSKGEGFFRISAFNSRANAEEVARRLQELKW